MADSLSVENLSRVIRTGDAEALMGESSAIRDSKVIREMEKNGMSAPGPTPGSVGESNATFSKMLRDSVDQVNLYQVQADTAIKEMVAGRSKNIHETMLTIERADTSLKLMMQVRNKLLDAYREIMRMQV